MKIYIHFNLKWWVHRPHVPASSQKHKVSNGGTWKNELTKTAFGKELVMVDRHGGGGHGGGDYAGAGTLNKPTHEKGGKPQRRGANSCSSNYIGPTHLAFLLFSSAFESIFVSLDCRES